MFICLKYNYKYVSVAWIEYDGYFSTKEHEKINLTFDDTDSKKLREK